MMNTRVSPEPSTVATPAETGILTTLSHLSLVRDDAGESEAIVASDSLSGIVEMLSRSPEWDGVFAWNEFEHGVVFEREPPFGDIARRGDTLKDEDITRVRLWFEKVHQVVVKKQNVLDAIRIVAWCSRIHPLRTYLESLTWDGTSRVDTWLEDFVGVKPTSPDHARLIRSVARKWLISCVARAMKPGSKVDAMLILEGRQGIGKSKCLAALAGERFFSDSLIDFRTKDACQNIQGVWIYELAELDALLRSENSTAKAFLTRSFDKFRAPYARTPMVIPRSTVFAGTINHGSYLKDHTGNRRFWVVRCGDAIDVDGLGTARDQLWAEARVLFEKGEPWHLSASNERLMRDEHEDRLVVDPWHEEIAEWVSNHGDKPFAVEAVLEGVLKLTSATRNPSVTRRVNHILERLGFERQRRSFGAGRRVYRYVRTSTTPEASETAPVPHRAVSKRSAPAKRGSKTATTARRSGTKPKSLTTTKSSKRGSR